MVPIYNGEKYLTKCIDSILAQKYNDFEVILIDDGSTDSSLSICREYEQKDSRVVVHSKENAGLCAARKSGVSFSKGEYVGFVDCDDFIDEDMYSTLMSEADKTKADIVTGGMVVDYSDRTVAHYHKIPEGFYEKSAIDNEVMPKALVHSGFIKFGLIPAVWSKIFRRNVLEEALVNVTDALRTGEDVAITLHSLSLAQSLSIIKSSDYHYIQSEGSMTRKFSPQRFKDVCTIWECISKIDNGKYNRQISTYIAYMTFIIIGECVEKSGYSKKEINEYITSALNHEIIVNCLKQVDTSTLSANDKLKVFLMRHKLVGMLKLMIKH